jgi:hypothetical protein
MGPLKRNRQRVAGLVQGVQDHLRFDTVHTVFTLFVDIDKVRLLFGPEYVLISVRGPSLSRISTATLLRRFPVRAANKVRSRVHMQNEEE